jgi:tRNA(fMet)-specific endonuclease VapC
VSFLIDSDICSMHLKNSSGKVSNRFLQHLGRLYVSTVTVGELYTWALRAAAPPKRLMAVLDLLRDVTILDVDHFVARKFGETHAALLDAGNPKPSTDLLIASTAIAYGLTLVTHNTKDFVGIPGLMIDDWSVP